MPPATILHIKDNDILRYFDRTVTYTLLTINETLASRSIGKKSQRLRLLASLAQRLRDLGYTVKDQLPGQPNASKSEPPYATVHEHASCPLDVHIPQIAPIVDVRTENPNPRSRRRKPDTIFARQKHAQSPIESDTRLLQSKQRTKTLSRESRGHAPSPEPCGRPDGLPAKKPLRAPGFPVSNSIPHSPEPCGRPDGLPAKKPLRAPGFPVSNSIPHSPEPCGRPDGLPAKKPLRAPGFPVSNSIPHSPEPCGRPDGLPAKKPLRDPDFQVSNSIPHSPEPCGRPDGLPAKKPLRAPGFPVSNSIPHCPEPCGRPDGLPAKKPQKFPPVHVSKSMLSPLSSRGWPDGLPAKRIKRTYHVDDEHGVISRTRKHKASEGSLLRLPGWAQQLSSSQREPHIDFSQKQNIIDSELEDQLNDVELEARCTNAPSPRDLYAAPSGSSCCIDVCLHDAAPSSRFCQPHIEAAYCKLRYPRSEKWMEELKWLNEFALMHPDKLWILDTEFQTFNDVCPVAFEVSIRRYSDSAVILKDTVDYGAITVGALLDQYHAMRTDSFRLHDTVANRIRNCFQRIYPGDVSSGSTFTQMRQVLIDKGFDPNTYAIISWGTTHDLQIFWKILCGHDMPFVNSSAKQDWGLGDLKFCTLQPVNVHYIVRHMVREKLDRFQLKDVYRHFFGLEHFKWHRADSDSLALLYVVRIIASYIVYGGLDLAGSDGL